MKTVYIVMQQETHGCCSQRSWLHDVFSTKKKAEKQAKELNDQIAKDYDEFSPPFVYFVVYKTVR